MITLNPYNNIDFAQCVTLMSNTHEHIFDQQKLENAYNRGLRNINLLHYGPSTPQRLDPNYQAEYTDYTSTTDLTKVTKLCPKRNFADFTDKDGNSVSLSDIVVVPNCEHVNISGYPYMLHTNYLGSEFGDPGWMRQDGDTSEWAPQWRIDHPILTDYELFDGVGNNLPFGKVFGTLNHPTDGISSYSITDQFIEHSDGLIQAVEIFNRGYQPATNKSFEDYYFYLLNKGHHLWALSVVDWQGDGPYTEDFGASLLLLPSDYASMTYIQKQNAILDAYIGGRYFPTGLGTIRITNIEQDEDRVTFTFNTSARIVYGIYDGEYKPIGSNISSICVDTRNASKFFMLKALGDGDDFIWTNPIYVNNKKKSIVDKFKVLF